MPTDAHLSQAISHALGQGGCASEVARTRGLSGGCIHQVLEVTLRDGRRLVAKAGKAQDKLVFEEEAHGLRALDATGAVLVPRPLACIAHADVAVLLLTAIEPPPPSRADASVWARLGDDLARLHQSCAGDRYGFEIDNHLGSTYQPNQWRDDWVEFNAVNRLGFQLEKALEERLLDAEQARSIESVINRLDRLIPRRPKPALLHGDLWSGNAIPGRDGQGAPRMALIDPACSIGDGWADIAMMKLFGGFHEACFAAYRASVGDREQVEQRLAVYQLYHVLNHVNIFGAGYVAQAMALTRRLS